MIGRLEFSRNKKKVKMIGQNDHTLKMIGEPNSEKKKTKMIAHNSFWTKKIEKNACCTLQMLFMQVNL